MKIDFSKFKPDDFLPILGTTCPAEDDLQTGDLLFPRSRKEAASDATLKRNRYSDLLSKDTTSELFGGEGKLIKILSPKVVKELRNKAITQDFSEARSLDITAVISEVISEAGNSSNQSNNSLYASHAGMQILDKAFDSKSEDAEALGIDFGSFLNDPKFLKLIIEILIKSGFTNLVNTWFDVKTAITLTDFRKDPLVKLLLDLFTSDDVRSSIFIGHVGMVIRGENNHVYVIEANITSYSHYRVSIHPYYVKNDDKNIQEYFTEKFKTRPIPYDASKDDTDYELPAAQASGWVNRRAAMLEDVWHASPNITVFGESADWQDKLISAAKAMHGRPYGFFDHPNLGNDDRMYCSEYIYNIFKNGISEAAAKKLTKKMTWGNIDVYLGKDGNLKMQAFVQSIIANFNIYKKTNQDPFFVLPPAILWSCPSLIRKFKPGNQEYAPMIGDTLYDAI